MSNTLKVKGIATLALTWLLIGCNSSTNAPVDTSNVYTATPVYPALYKDVTFNDSIEIDTNQNIAPSSPIVVSDSEKTVLIKLINKWHNNFFSGTFDLLPYLCKAGITDYATVNYTISGFTAFSKDGLTSANSWAGTYMSHIQKEPIFVYEPGNTPWGSVNSVPTYKKMLPSEMRAMRLYTNKISGECTSLATMIVSILRNRGIAASDIICLRLSGHTVALVMINKGLYIIDNNKVSIVESVYKAWVKKQTFQGAFNDSLYKAKTFSLNIDSLLRGDTLQENTSLVALLQTYCGFVLEKTVKDSTLAAQTLDRMKSDYCAQYLNVTNPGIYLDAAIVQPLTISLAKELTIPDSICSWMKKKLYWGSIFTDCTKRIMTSDQVIVYKTGTAKDRALLFAALMKLNSRSVSVSITARDAFVKVDNKSIYSMKSLTEVTSVTGSVKVTF